MMLMQAVIRVVMATASSQATVITVTFPFHHPLAHCPGTTAGSLILRRLA